jgi:hypothetical protein
VIMDWRSPARPRELLTRALQTRALQCRRDSTPRFVRRWPGRACWRRRFGECDDRAFLSAPPPPFGVGSGAIIDFLCR